MTKKEEFALARAVVALLQEAAERALAAGEGDDTEYLYWARLQSQVKSVFDQ